MATHDYVIANQGFPAFRSDLNNALAAIVSNNSSATEPTTMFAHMVWVDTAANPSILKIRNADNDAWITIGSIDQTGDTFTLTSAVSATTLNTSGAVVFNDAGADVDFRVEGDTDANLLFVDASADAVGIGTNAPAHRLDVSKTTAGDVARFTNAAASNKSLFVYTDAQYASIATGTSASGNGIAFDVTNNSILFTTASQNRAAIDSSGNLLVGATTAAFTERFLVRTSNASGNSATFTHDNNADNPVVITYHAGSNGATSRKHFSFRNLGSTEVGSISCTGSATAYNTSSDYRLKENIAPMTGALAKVLELNPVTYTWKVDGSDGEGFIAHELQEVAPYAVSGEKDGEEMQGVDYGKITPLLTAALQEAMAEIQSLKARIEALEAK